MGAYSTPVTNAIVNGGTGTVIPTFREGGDNTVTVSHKEYIGDVFGPEAAGQFQNTVYPINPGLVRTFPWLSQVAANYEEFTLKQCIFTYRTTVTDFVSSGGQVGTIIMATQYNPSDPPFANKQDAMEYDLAMSGKVSEHMLHGVECDPRLNSGTSGKYTRSGPVRQDQDLKSYDHGNLNVCVSNIPQAFANQALGELWVSYTVELRKPKFFVSRGLAIQRDLIVGRTLPGTPLTLADIVDAGQYGLGQQNRIGLEVSLVAKGNETALPPGQVRIRFPQTFSGTVAIKLHVISKGPGQGIVAPFIATYAAPLGTSGIAMFPVADLLSTEPLAPFDTAWQPMVESFTDTTADHSEAQNEWHFNVLTPTSAGTTVDNYFDIGILCTVHAFSLDVAVYNTLFNYPTSNNPVIENPTTSVIEPWP
jgi:hypothetical protein